VVFLGGAHVLFAGMCFAVNAGFLALRATFTVMASAGLLYRLAYYSRKEWVMYCIDLCYVNSILLIWTLWACVDGRCSDEWNIAIDLVGSGAVAGSTFMLLTPLTLHHPESFESFFMHVSPMWVGYCRRWTWGTHGATLPPVADLVRMAFSKVYAPWMAAYLAILLAQPFLGETFAGYETLMDLQLFPGATRAQRLHIKRGSNYPKYAFKVIMCVAVHAFASFTGFLAAAFAFRCWLASVLWIVVIQIGCLYSSYHFYRKSADPFHDAPGLLQGLRNMGFAWLSLAPTYAFLCAG